MFKLVLAFLFGVIGNNWIELPNLSLSRRSSLAFCQNINQALLGNDKLHERNDEHEDSKFGSNNESTSDENVNLPSGQPEIHAAEGRSEHSSKTSSSNPHVHYGQRDWGDALIHKVADAVATVKDVGKKVYHFGEKAVETADLIGHEWKNETMGLHSTSSEDETSAEKTKENSSDNNDETSEEKEYSSEVEDESTEEFTWF